ncbi:HEAT repeat domain-containing protein [Archangium violaceum]|uniref:HEAT repeat domain-containing protein n=1 Tax=Archangium violaceum TaxID=83451 RepID=UPI002B27FA4E|nr:HEAT repeat domain-containing protein [Archangium violaceum]
MAQEKTAQQELEHWNTVELDSAEVARRASVLILDFEAHPEKYTDPEALSSPFSRIVGLFQQPTVKEAAVTLRAEALPALLRLYDARLREWRKAGPREGYDSAASDLLFALKIFAMYRGEEALQRIIDAARIPLDADDYMWSVILSALVKAEPEAAIRVAAALREPLPPGFIAVALLDMANTLAREHGVTSHPFDTARGRELLQAFLSDEDPDHYGYAHSAAASLPFLTDSRELFTVAQEHPDVAVRMEAAWAAASRGDALALARLQDWSKDPKTRKRAMTYLKELGSPPAPVPEEELPRLDAMAEMSQWLEHPSEFGRAPDHLEVYDHRRLFWPPTNDERDVWLLRYRYDDEEGTSEEGVGMVGSVTFALFGEATAGMPPEDIYALHCVWELQQEGDKRAPKERTVEAGRKLLGLQ